MGHQDDATPGWLGALLSVILALAGVGAWAIHEHDINAAQNERIGVIESRHADMLRRLANAEAAILALEREQARQVGRRGVYP